MSLNIRAISELNKQIDTYLHKPDELNSELWTLSSVTPLALSANYDDKNIKALYENDYLTPDNDNASGERKPILMEMSYYVGDHYESYKFDFSNFLKNLMDQISAATNEKKNTFTKTEADEYYIHRKDDDDDVEHQITYDNKPQYFTAYNKIHFQKGADFVAGEDGNADTTVTLSNNVKLYAYGDAEFTGDNTNISNLSANSLKATTGNITSLIATTGNITDFTAYTGKITNLTADNLSAKFNLSAEQLYVATDITAGNDITTEKGSFIIKNTDSVFKFYNGPSITYINNNTIGIANNLYVTDIEANSLSTTNNIETKDGNIKINSLGKYLLFNNTNVGIGSTNQGTITTTTGVSLNVDGNITANRDITANGGNIYAKKNNNTYGKITAESDITTENGNIIVGINGTNDNNKIYFGRDNTAYIQKHSTTAKDDKTIEVSKLYVKDDIDTNGNINILTSNKALNFTYDNGTAAIKQNSTNKNVVEINNLYVNGTTDLCGITNMSSTANVAQMFTAKAGIETNGNLKFAGNNLSVNFNDQARITNDSNDTGKIVISLLKVGDNSDNKSDKQVFTVNGKTNLSNDINIEGTLKFTDSSSQIVFHDNNNISSAGDNTIDISKLKVGRSSELTNDVLIINGNTLAKGNINIVNKEINFGHINTENDSKYVADATIKRDDTYIDISKLKITDKNNDTASLSVANKAEFMKDITINNADAKLNFKTSTDNTESIGVGDMTSSSKAIKISKLLVSGSNNNADVVDFEVKTGKSVMNKCSCNKLSTTNAYADMYTASKTGTNDVAFELKGQQNGLYASITYDEGFQQSGKIAQLTAQAACWA